MAETLASPLTHILNNCVSNQTFPSSWKLAHISPIPKSNDPKCNDDYRPISILPVLSKIYEKLILRQIADFLSDEDILHQNISAYRKGHSTTTALLAMRDEIRNAMNRGEITLAVMADFSKAFDTVTYKTILLKLHAQGFSKDSLRWITNYLTGRRQFVQIDDRISETINVTSGIPQGSILGPALFNLYVNDLAGKLPKTVKSHQYADDTTMYAHCKPKVLQHCQSDMQRALNELHSWSTETNLTPNASKTKTILFSTQQMSHVHKLENYNISLSCDGLDLEKLSSLKLLGANMNEHLSWVDHINNTIASCYSIPAILRKLNHSASFSLKKQLVECLIFSRLDFNSSVLDPLPAYLIKILSRVQLCAAAFVNNRYAGENDIVNLGWLPVPERREYHLLKLAHKALHNPQWPLYLPLERYTHPEL